MGTFEAMDYDPSDPSTFGYAAIITKKFEGTKKLKEGINRNTLERQKASLKHNRIKSTRPCFMDIQNIQKKFDLACRKIDRLALHDDLEIGILRDAIEKLIEAAQFYLDPHDINPYDNLYFYFLKDGIAKTIDAMLIHLKYMLIAHEMQDR
ncbi:MAG: hypothetical protein LBI77_01630 [Puniceicoccales bacterium]|jgi:hypothetical protein|nr:hypothetical protein [Puniceicoccales bacterium]